MSDNAGSYSIVSTMREAPEIIAAFVAHHLTTEAETIFVFLDGPDPVAQDMLAALPRCQVTICDDAYWQDRNRGKRPGGVVRRQLFNAQQARLATRSEWLIHIDADEFLWLGTGLRQELAGLAASVDRVRLRNIERVMPEGKTPQHIYQGVFRSPLERGQNRARQIYGEDLKFLNRGLSGYVLGKTISRVASSTPLTLHLLPRDRNGEPVVFPTAGSTTLLHFDGFTTLHWVSKLLKHLANGTLGTKFRQEQMSFLYQAKSAAERFSLFQRLNVLDVRKMSKLAGFNALTDIAFDPMPAMQTHFPGRDFDLSPQAFDRRMIAANPTWFSELDLMP